MKLKTGDRVLVIAGASKGKEGKVNKVLDNKVIVEGINMIKKHLKPKNNNGTGEIIETEAPIHKSNVRVVDSKKEKTTKSKEKKTVKVEKEVSKKEKKTTKKTVKENN